MVRTKTSLSPASARILRFVLILVLSLAQVPCVSAIDQTLSYVSFQTGSQDLTAPGSLLGSSADYFSSLENTHGSISGDREVRPEVFSFDFYRASNALASGFGIEVHRYNKEFRFQDNSEVGIYAVGVLYGFNFYYRGDIWFPFLGFGTGNYSAKVQETLYAVSSTTNSTIFGQVDTPLYYKIGFRIPFNSWGIIFTQQFISADMLVASENNKVSLGGTATLFGVYYGF